MYYLNNHFNNPHKMKTIKILFADDDLKYSMLLKRFLEAEGYEVTYAGNGSIALQQFPLIRPDLVLLDINMPELNGFEVAEHIRGNVSLRKQRIS